MTKDFCYYLRVRYSECDAQKVVFNARYGDYVGLATAEYIRAAGLHDEFNRGIIGYQLVKQTIQWKASAHFDQILELLVRLQKIGNTSFTIDTEIRIAGSDGLLATAETVFVLIDEKTMQKEPLRDKHRQALAHGAPGITADHAGYFMVKDTGKLHNVTGRKQFIEKQ